MQGTADNRGRLQKEVGLGRQVSVDKKRGIIWQSMQERVNPQTRIH
jgi:hypothetical protein